MKAVLYGIPNCDSIKKARRWLESRAVDYEFVDFRRAAPSPELIGGWIDAVGEKALVNKRSTTWKNLSASEQEAVELKNALPVLAKNPTLIKRPVLEYRGDTVVGFDATDYELRFKS